MKVALLTLIQKESLQGVEYNKDCLFNPIEDKNNNWILSVDEIQKNQNKKFEWLHKLPLIELNITQPTP